MTLKMLAVIQSSPPSTSPSSIPRQGRRRQQLRPRSPGAQASRARPRPPRGTQPATRPARLARLSRHSHVPLICPRTLCCYVIFPPLSLPGTLCNDMTSSSKPEIHKILHCRPSRTEPRSQLTCTGNFIKFGHVVFDIRE